MNPRVDLPSGTWTITFENAHATTPTGPVHRVHLTRDDWASSMSRMMPLEAMADEDALREAFRRPDERRITVDGELWSLRSAPGVSKSGGEAVQGRRLKVPEGALEVRGFLPPDTSLGYVTDEELADVVLSGRL